MIEEDRTLEELVKACFYCGSTNITRKEIANNLVRHTCNACGKKNILTRAELNRNPKKEYYSKIMDGKTYGRKNRVLAKRYFHKDLKKSDVVHHINLCKKNNSKENLFVYSSMEEHTKAHHDLRKIIIELINKKVIKFDKEKKTYFY